MANRFPFDPNNSGNNAGRAVTNAQMRAALGLPSVDELSANLYVEQQQRLEAQQRDLRYRSAFYQDQIDHQLQELQRRANAVAELEHLPDIQQHYANLLLSERFGRGGAEHVDAAAAYRAQQQQQQQQYAATASSVPPTSHAAFAHPAHQASVQQAQAAAAAAAQLRYQEELRQHQQQQTAALQAHLRVAPPATVTSLDQLVMRSASQNSNTAPAPPPHTSLSSVNAVGAAAIPKSSNMNQAPAPFASASAGESVDGSVSVGTSERHSLPRKNSSDSVELEDYVIEQHKKHQPDTRTKHGNKKDKSKPLPSSSDASLDQSQHQQHIDPKQAKPSNKRKRGRPRKPSDAAAAVVKPVQKKKKEVVDEAEQQQRAEALRLAMEQRAAGMQVETEPMQTEKEPPEKPVPTPEEKIDHVVNDRDQSKGIMDHSEVYVPVQEEDRMVSTSQKFYSSSLGTIGGILAAANAQEKAFDAAHVLQILKDAEWNGSDEVVEQTKEPVQEDEPVPVTPIEKIGLETPKKPYQSIVTSMMHSHFPRLPEEPVFDEVAFVQNAEGAATDQGYSEDVEKAKSEEKKTNDHQAATQEDENKKSKVDKKIAAKKQPERKSNILDYPYPIDTWWPSTAGRRRERRQAGETSDEDDFDDPPESQESERLLRANDRKILERLHNELEPGVLEKIPHCRIHRQKRKSTGALAELVYCFQVTECYPGDMMVCCSRCGTWRHAACGGHYEPYSIRKNIEEPFVPVCEQCHEEERLLNDHPVANARIERQRMEQLRRGLSTTAVMRSMSFSKHGGTYKWPLGSVSATHVGGHTRSVQARHDKAEKQWADLLTRLGRGFGYRAKERQRVRTKELERLLVAIEDAEGQTDRHNMLLFLLRDTKKPMPVGFEAERKNLFDPCFSDEQFDSNGYTPAGRRSESQKQKKQTAEGEGKSKKDNTKEHRICLREDCNNEARFDSRFCCDGCGVHVLELDLLQAFYESNDIHPSVLRSHY